MAGKDRQGDAGFAIANKPDFVLCEDGGCGSGGGMPTARRFQEGFYNVGMVQVGEEISILAGDVQTIRTLKTPELPSREAVEEHRIHHRPYRSWCDECVEGAGREDGHSNVESQSIAMISMDYLFITRK